MGKFTDYQANVPERTADSVRQEAETSFWLVVAASLNQTSDFYRTLFAGMSAENVLENLSGINGQAFQIVQFMTSYYDDHDTMPSEQAFKDRFRDKPVKAREGYSKTELTSHCDKVITCAKRFGYLRTLTEMAKHVIADGITATDAQSIYKMSSEGIPDQIEMDPLEELKRRKEAGGYRVFVEELDKNCRGIKKGSVATIAAYAGGFKTCWAINIALRNALEKKHIVYISFEVDKAQLYARLYSALSRCPESPLAKNDAIPFEAVFHQIMSPKQQEDLENVIVPFYNQNVKPYLTLLDESDIAPTDMDEDELTQLLYRIDDQRPIDVLVVDHIGMTKFYRAHGKNKGVARDEFSQINNYVSYFRSKAVNFRIGADGCPREIGVLLLCQINRQGYERALKDSQNNDTKDEANSHHGRYTLTSLAEANEVEKASSYVFTIFANRESNTAFIQLLKNRNGAPLEDGVCAPIEPEYSRFGDLTIVPEDALYADLGKTTTIPVNTFGDNIESDLDTGNLLSYVLTDDMTFTDTRL